jgi:hypothetical protein
MRDKTRNVIRRAAETMAVENCHDPAEFTTAYHRHLASAAYATIMIPA